MRVRAALVLAALVSTAPLGCSTNKDPAPWIDEASAVVQCTTAGRTRMQPVLLGLPFPRAPTGLYARGLDPMALNDMGYQRDKPVCAALHSPTPEAIRQASEEVPALATMIQQTSRTAVRMTCGCATAEALGVRELVTACATKPAKACGVTEARKEALTETLAPLADLIESTTLPRRHWRLVGPTDRPTWFAERVSELLGRHTGGSTIYLRGQAVPARDNYVLLRRLLEHPDVVAVARQDGGRAVMVARVIEGMQIIDHFELPALARPMAPIRAYLDNARPQDVVAALDKPVGRYAWGVSPAKGNFFELDTAALERVDAMTVAASSLSGLIYDPADEEREEPPVWVRRIAVQAPFGVEGRALHVRTSLTDLGAAWAAGLDDTRLGADLDPLGLSGDQPRFVAATTPPPPFLLRGTPANRVLVHGIHRMARVMQAMELHRPGAVEGTTLAWDFAMAQGALSLGQGVPSSLRALREQVVQRDYRVTAKLDAAGATLLADITPR
ncbi:MAG: hypothetical protein AAF721_25255 [Myxococcota bacterium]